MSAKGGVSLFAKKKKSNPTKKQKSVTASNNEAKAKPATQQNAEEENVNAERVEEQTPEQKLTALMESAENDQGETKEVAEKTEDADAGDEEEVAGTLSWSELGVEPWLESHLLKLKMKIPTIIQEKCIPPTVKGQNIIGMAQTGTGKTAAFAIPILQHLAKDMFGIFALVVTPTRELAQQIKQNFEILSGDMPVRVALVTGGQSYLQLAQTMDARPHIVVGTPGMIEGAMRHFNNDNYFKKIKYLVFDEADQLLRADFALDIDTILKASNPNRKTLLYSATMDKHVKKLAQQALKKDPDNVYIFDACKLYATAENLKQYYIFMPDAIKDCYLYALLKKFQAQGKKTISIVFFSDLEKCEVTMRTLKLMGIECDALHAGKPQVERFKVLDDFKHRRIQALFCTDVANRGLDIPSVTYVINYDLPPKTRVYVHRVGRTARAGQSGTSISLVSQFDVKRIETIEKDVNLEMEKYEDISEEDAEEYMIELAEKKCKARIELLESGFIERYSQVKENRAKTRAQQEQAKVRYEQEYLNMLKASTNKLNKLKQKQMEFRNKQAQASGASEQQAEPKQASTSQGEAASTPAKKKVVGGITLIGAGTKRKRTEDNEGKKTPKKLRQ